MEDRNDSLPIEIEKRIRELARQYESALKEKIDQRMIDMDADDNSHYLIYQALGVSYEEGRLIDSYQNKGRFLYKYAGAFLEASAKICFIHKFPDSRSKRIENRLGGRPKTFEIDCLVNEKDAFEIKWRDATTDGDHITKEHARLKAIADANYKPIRIMFYYPNRDQAIRIQKTLETLYAGVNGEYYYADSAWKFLLNYTGIDLKRILETIASENKNKWRISDS